MSTIERARDNLESGGGPPADSVQTPQRRLRVRPLSPVGSAGALLFALMSVTPSFVPRAWTLQVVLLAVSAVTGYALGAFIGWTYRALGLPCASAKGQRLFWYVLAAIAVLGSLLAGWVGRQWQIEQQESFGMSGDVPLLWLVTPIAGMALALLLLGLGRLVRLAALVLLRPLVRIMPPRVAWLVAVVVTALITWAVSVDLLGMGERRLDASFEASNRGDYPWVSDPDSPTRSGGPRSTVTWESIGQEGRDFISQGLSATEITTVTGVADARDPVLAYIGLGAAEAPRERARLAMAELEALGGFDRAAIAVAGVTGRGWIDPQASQALQYVTGGDVAIVGMQYSYLPSWMALLVSRERAAQDAGFLLDALLVEIKGLPPDQRPKVYVFGESLGAFSAESAFSSVESISATTDGALFIGPPSFSPNWQSVQIQREPESPLWKPIYGEAGLVHVAESESDLTDTALQWGTEAPIIYLVNDSDPVVGWTVDHGEWLDPRGPDTSPHMRSWPIVTSLQATVDQFGATAVPSGHGHVYDDRVVAAWSEIVGANLTTTQIDTIRAAVDDLPRS